MKVSREQAIENERNAWDLRQQGWTHQRIADHLDLDRSTVTRILARLSLRYAKSLAADVAAVKGDQVNQLEHIADEALQAWRRSIGEMATTTTKAVFIKVGRGEDIEEVPGTETTTKVETKAGEAAYLTAAMKALADIRDITGANAPQKVAPTDPSGEKPYQPTRRADLAAISDEDFLTIDAILSKAADSRGTGG